MSKRILLVATAAIALVGSGSRSSAQEGTSRSELSEIGRYQLVRVSETHFFLIDTATGNCWSRTPDADWRDEGNPTKSRDRKLPRASERAVPKLNLPGESIEMIVMQREERSIPGSDGSVRIRLGDITDGQALLSVGSDDEDNLLDRTSVAQGDTVQFSVGKQKYTVHIEELRNVLIGDDLPRSQLPRPLRRTHGRHGVLPAKACSVAKRPTRALVRC